MVSRRQKISLVLCAAGWLTIGLIVTTCRAAGPSPDDEAISAAEKLHRQPGKVELQLKPTHAAIRSDAPFSIQIDLKSTFSELLEGELELTFVDDSVTRLRMRTAALAVPKGEKSFRMVLPALSAGDEHAEFVAGAVFDAERGPINLGMHDLVVPTKGRRQFVLGTAGLADASIGYLARHLGLEAFSPPELPRSVLLTLPVELDPKEIAADPISLYPFDVLVLAGEHFSRLSSRQLDTIAAWVESGGAAVVVPTGVLTSAHTQFLERLSGRDAGAPSYDLDRFGRLPLMKPGSGSWLTAGRVGFGRALVLRSLPEFNRDGSLSGVEKQIWTRAICFLWNIRREQTSEIVKQGVWRFSPSQDVPEKESLPPPPASKSNPLLKSGPTSTNKAARPRYRGPSPDWVKAASAFSRYDFQNPLHQASFAGADELRNLLFPEEVRVVPFRVVATILGLFLVAIAPVDYLFLGLLRRRKYTWVLFPTTSLLFTAATVWIAGYYAGRADHLGALVIVDLSHEGKALRTTRVEHLITAGAHEVTTEVKNGVFDPTLVQPRKAPDDSTPVADPLDRLRNPTALAPAGADRVPTFTGTPPLKFSVSRFSRQWSPSMARLTQSGADVPLPSIFWSEFEKIDISAQRGRETVVERIRHAIPDCEFLFLTGSQQVLFKSAAWAEGRRKRFANWPAVLSALSRRADKRMFGIVFQISPNGAGDLEDLSVLDTADSAGCILHVAVQKGDDLVVFRRPMRASQRVSLN